MQEKLMMRKAGAVFAGLMMILAACCGCSREGDLSGREKLRVVCTVFPAYDWAREILGERLEDTELTLLLENGTDMHSYQPTAADMIKIADCDLFVYVGGESDRWIPDLLSGAVNPDMKTVDMLTVLGERVKTEEAVEGMETPEEEEEAPENDEHVWLSLNNASELVTAIAGELSELDPENAAVYSENAAAYKEQLSVLDSEYRAAADGATVGALIFGDRFPFRYLTDDYGIKYYAAFPGCSAETRASFETVIFLAEKADELEAPCILAIEGTQHEIAQTVSANTKSGDKPVLTVNSMQSATLAEALGGMTYLSAARENLEVFRIALNG